MRCLKHNHNHKVDQLTQLSLQIQAQELFSAVSGVNLLCGSFLVDIALAPCIILFCVCVCVSIITNLQYCLHGRHFDGQLHASSGSLPLAVYFALGK